MSDTVVKLKTIANLTEEKAAFFIDAYQRGYRWTECEVRDLLDDIREFSQIRTSDEKAFYCLQPIIVTQADDGIAWKVIDGQQRLTTLYLIYTFYRVTASRFMRGAMPFSLHYNNKPLLEECLNILVDGEFDCADRVDEQLNRFENDIDCHYVLSAYKCICDYFSKIVNDPNTVNDVNDMKKIFDNRMKIIWYELVNCTVQTEVSVFSKINMGKIALTNAELIKALLLKKDAQDSDDLVSTQMNIAVKWDEIESNLSEDSFWSFLVNSDDVIYSTRIDFIFRIMAREINDSILVSADKKYSKDETYSVNESLNKDKFSFYVFSNYVRLLVKHPEENADPEQNYISCIWNGICEYYRMFKDWYQNVHWYHLIGFLVETSKQKYIDEILALSKLYRTGSSSAGEGHKEFFESEMRKMIAREVFHSEDCHIDSCKEFINGLDYTVNPGDIRNILLLYNISYLDACKENGRFPFEKYKDRNIAWDIEHINAVADSMPADDRRDTDDNPRLLWLKNTRMIPDIANLKTIDGKNVPDLVETLIQNKGYLAKNDPGTKDFIQVYEAIINHFGGNNGPDNSISNLTLLDMGTNRSYKNDVFPLKRKTILNLSMGDVFIPLCTKKVFMKGFADSEDLIRWHDVDKTAYREEIVSCISNYLGLEENANEQ